MCLPENPESILDSSNKARAQEQESSGVKVQAKGQGSRPELPLLVVSRKQCSPLSHHLQDFSTTHERKSREAENPLVPFGLKEAFASGGTALAVLHSKYPKQGVGLGPEKLAIEVESIDIDWLSSRSDVEVALALLVIIVDDVVIGGLGLILGIIVQLFRIAVQERVLLVLYPNAVVAVLSCILLLCKEVGYSIVSQLVAQFWGIKKECTTRQNYNPAGWI
ncbi:hypothetical protein B0J11DRAFT_508371 [Dendryphion nanum]|uniref:Uncharacterized protein n=1 Tax=Dendryphion nanum TaxID=256645 RepID=A0A9P9DI08_9PLEO|nr:hypothetical protein B0J11DRAFT_508371 [Dendryphion nanum]